MHALAHPFFGEAAAVAPPGSMPRVANTLLPPFRCVCRIVACSYDKPGYSVGTGFFVSPYHVVTCAHVIYPAEAPRTRTIDVYPAQNGANQAGGRYRANGWAIRRGWSPNDCRTAGFDFGVIRLATPAPHGFFALRPFDAATLRGKTVHLAGYPDVPDRRAQFMHQSLGSVSGTVTIQTCGVNARGEPTMGGRVVPLTSGATGLVAHSLPASHAVSGAPLWIDESGTRTLVAIHARSIDGGASRAAVLVDDVVRAQITSWMNRELPPLRR